MTVTSFEFATAGRILAGAGRAAELPDVLAGFGSRVLVCTGADPARHDGLRSRVPLSSAVGRARRRPAPPLDATRHSWVHRLPRRQP